MTIRLRLLSLAILTAVVLTETTRSEADGRLVAGTTLSHQVAILDQQPEGSYLLLPPVSWKSVEDFADILPPEIEEAVAAKARAFQDQTGIRLVFVTCLNEATPITVQRARRMLSDQDPAAPLAIFVVQFSGIHNAAVLSPGLLAKIEPESMRSLIGLASTRSAGQPSAAERFNTFIAECLQLIRNQLGLPLSTQTPVPEKQPDPAKLAAAEFSLQRSSTVADEKTQTASGTEIIEFNAANRSGRTPQIAKLRELSNAARPTAQAETTATTPLLSQPLRGERKHVPDLFEILLYWLCGILAVAAIFGLGMRLLLHRRAKQEELKRLRKAATGKQQSAREIRKPLRSEPHAVPWHRLKTDGKDRKDAAISIKPRDPSLSNGKRNSPSPRATGTTQLERFTKSAHMLRVVPPRLRLRLLKAMEKQIDRVEAELTGAPKEDSIE